MASAGMCRVDLDIDIPPVEQGILAAAWQQHDWARVVVAVVASMVVPVVVLPYSPVVVAVAAPEATVMRMSEACMAPSRRGGDDGG